MRKCTSTSTIGSPRRAAFLDGRVTYELMASYWPTADQDPAASAQVIEFARIWRDMPKIVFSRTLEQAGWNTTIVREVVPEQIAELKAQPGGDLVIGGSILAAAFLAHDLIDEFRFYVQPVILGRGRLLFQPDGREGQPPARRDPRLRQRRRPAPLRAPARLMDEHGVCSGWAISHDHQGWEGRCARNRSIVRLMGQSQDLSIRFTS